MSRCTLKTKRGTQCKLKALNGHYFCHIHETQVVLNEWSKFYVNDDILGIILSFMYFKAEPLVLISKKFMYFTQERLELFKGYWFEDLKERFKETNNYIVKIKDNNEFYSNFLKYGATPELEEYKEKVILSTIIRIHCNYWRYTTAKSLELMYTRNDLCDILDKHFDESEGLRIFNILYGS